MKSFLELAHTMRDESEAARAALARLADVREAPVPIAIEVERLRQRAGDLAQVAQLLDELVPNERVVRLMIEVGVLASLPTVSRDTSNMRGGDEVLVKATLGSIANAAEPRIVFGPAAWPTSVTVERARILGVMREPPTMFPAALTRRS